MGKLPPSVRSPVQYGLTSLKKTAYFSPKPQIIPKKKPEVKSPHSQFQPPLITFTSPSLSEAKTLFTSLISSRKKTTPFNLRFYNTVLQSFSSVSTLQDAIFFLNHMVKTHPPFLPERSTYHVLLIQACKSAEESLSPVYQVLNLMNTNGFPPNTFSIDIAARTLCLSGHEDHAVELVKDLCSKNSPPDSNTYNFLVKHLSKNRSVSNMNAFVDDMKTKFGIKPDLVTYTIMIDNVCNKKNIREATRLLDVLSKEGYKPDSYVYNTIMKGYCMLSTGGEVLGVYKKMLDEGVKPDLVTYNTLIYGLSKSGMVQQAKKFLRVMVENGHVPDAVTYTSLMNGMSREGDAKGALSLLEEMELKGCEPNSCTYSTLLHGLCKARLLEDAVGLYGTMKQNGMKLEKGSYGTFVRALCRNGRVAEAYEVFDYAVDSKSLTDVAAYTTLESTLKWLTKAREQGLVV
ncbi:unnamed protein product [Cuscuta campestris]|uniref:Pentacotripeptide-repeat region of PRORP domain-containing protein n=1 Tax=Cuscuta campestris TaxID=132261 RepID=A0A484MUU5_9ASTE|nr:unnamed protein product [Cuscuta campestris]VFQ92728.1 unnamed protein product [Cuscuta campestris]